MSDQGRRVDSGREREEVREGCRSWLQWHKAGKDYNP